MASLGQVYVGVRFDEQDVRRQADRIGDDITRRVGDQGGHDAGRHFSGGLRASLGAGPLRVIGAHIGSSILAGFAAVGVAKGIGKIISTGVSEISDYQKGFAQLQSGLKSTGNVAGLTADQMEALASKIQNYSGQTDDSIVATEQLLLTFTNIKDVAGKNNDIFTQTTTIAADMAARLGGDASAAAIQLGKALNDPVKGITALTRVGVSFSAQQVKQIGDMTKVGNTVGAQKIILAELNKEFGGSAKAVGDTLPGQIQRGKRAFEDLSQTIVGAVAPAFTTVVTKLSGFLTAVGPKLQQGIGLAGTAIRSLIGGFTDIDANYSTNPFEQVFLKIGDTARKVFNGIKPAVQDVITFVKEDLLPSFANLAAVLKGPAEGAVTAIIAAFRAAGLLLKNVLGPALLAVTKFMKDHQTLVKSVAITVGVAVVAWKAWQAAIKVWAAVTKTAAAVQAAFNVVMDANPIGLVIIAIAALAAGLIYAYKHSETFRNIIKDAMHIASVAINWVVDAAKTVVSWIGGHWPLLVGIMAGPIGIAVYYIATHFKMFKKLAEDGLRFVVDKFLDAAGWILRTASHMFGWVPGVGGKLKSASRAFDSFRDDVNRALGGIDENKKITVTATAALTDSSGSLISDSSGYSAYARGHASGGAIYGPGTGTSDSIPARLSNNEHIWTASEVAAAGGHSAVMRMRKAVLASAKGYAFGGPVVSASADASGFARQTAAWDNSIPGRVIGAFQSIVSKLAASFTGTIGGGVQQWAGLVSQVLAQLGLSPGLLGKVLAQMTTESGGNPTAINLTDSNALAGHPSQGLMQVIPGTFAAYAGPYASLGILNPLANIYAGLNYARNRYGSSLAGLGEGHGYDNGGWLKPGATLVHNNTGRPENVQSPQQRDEIADLLRQLIRVTAGQGAQFAGVLDGRARTSRLDQKTRTRG